MIYVRIIVLSIMGCVMADTSSGLHADILASAEEVSLKQRNSHNNNHRHRSRHSNQRHTNHTTTNHLHHHSNDKTTSTVPTTNKNNDDNNIENNNVCRTYLAPSTIPGAGLGMFAGINFNEGDEVTPGDAVIPLRDMAWNNDDNIETTFLWDEYIWAGDTFEGMKQIGYEIDGASFGIGAVPNCFFPLLNVEDGNEVQNDYADAINTAGVGAFTPFYNRQSYATQHIQAYTELFVDYGYAYFKGSRQKIYGLIPFLEHFERADKMLAKFITITSKIRQKRQNSCNNNNNKKQKKQKQKNCKSIEDEWVTTIFRSELYNLTKSIIRNFPSRTLLALPDNHIDIEYLFSIGGTAQKDYKRSVKDLQYLHDYGECMDNLIVQTSTIKEAGRGAFTTKYLSNGTIVAPVPLIHLPNRRVLDIYEKGPINIDTYEASKKSPNDPIHYQLLINYCYGHRDSSLLLCPYGVVSSLVNHAPTEATDDGGPTANVKIVWSNKLSSHPEWRIKPISEWAYNYQTGLTFNYVAIRDIKEGEEIFVDYGNEWQDAWDAHVRNWKNTNRLIDRLNDDIDSILPTIYEKRYSWDDPNYNVNNAATTWCYSSYREMRGLPTAEDDAYPCKIILRQNDEDGNPVYVAEIVMHIQNDDHDNHEDYYNNVCYEEFDEILFNVPRDAFAFGGQYTLNDTFQYAHYKSFRHDLRIPDQIFPQVWKNLLLQEDEEEEEKQENEL